VRRIFRLLLKRFGPQQWWPATSPLEIMVGAILTQNTAWINVERALTNLRNGGIFSYERLRDLTATQLASLIRPAGAQNVKAARIKGLLDALGPDFEATLAALAAGDLASARQRLLHIKGVGPETADAILLYVLGRPTFVVDAYTRRIFRRHFLIMHQDGYETVQGLFHESLPLDAAIFNEYHALLVVLGKQFCQVNAKCQNCPLSSLPHNPFA
jgi:endonuclease III related protein